MCKISHLFITLLILLSGIIHAEESSLVASSTGYLPPGFEHINNDYDGNSSIYLGNSLVGNAYIKYKDHADELILSEEAQKLLYEYVEPQLQPEFKKTVKTQLDKILHANSRLENNYLARSEKNVSAYYSTLNMDVFIYVPNKYLKTKSMAYKYSKEQQYKLSYTPTMTNSFNISYDKYQDQSLNWQSNGGISVAKMNIKYDANGQITSYFNDLYAEYYDKKYIYKLGYIESRHKNIIAPSGSIWGISAVTSPKIINKDFYEAYQAPLYINLNQPYDVSIYYRGRKLFSGMLPQGESVIDTGKFPKGSYQIEIKKRDLISGITTSETQMFYGQSGRYNWLYSGFELFAGFESEYFDSVSGDKTPYIRIANGYSMFDGEVDVSYIYGEKINYVGAEYDYISNSKLDYQGSIYLSQFADWYFAANVSYNQGDAKYQAYVRNGFQENEYKQGRQHDLGGSLSYKYGKWNVNVNASLSGSGSYSIGSIMSRSFEINGLPIGFSISNNYNESGRSTILSLQMSFGEGDITASHSMNYNSYGDLNISSSVNWKKEDYYLGQRFSLAPTGNDASYSYTNAGYKNKFAKFESNISFTKDQDSIYTNSLGYSISSNLLIGGGRFMFSQNGFNSGYFVQLPVINKEKKYMFNVENNKYEQGENLFISKPDFSESAVLVSPLSTEHSINYQYENKFLFPNNIVVIAPKLKRSCFVSFTPVLENDSMFTIVGRENDFFGNANVKNTFQLNEGEKIVIQELGYDNLCDTGVVVKCSGEKVNLGSLTCIK